MENNEESLRPQLPAGFALAPLHARSSGIPLSICVLIRIDPKSSSSPFVLLRELPEARVYLGGICDAEGKIQEWVDIWLQTIELRDLSYSGYQERLSNYACEQRWLAEWAAIRKHLPHCVITTGMEEKHPSPVLIKWDAARPNSVLAEIEVSEWQLCKDDALLVSFGLPPYSTSSFRYLHEPEVNRDKTFLATASDAPVNSHVQAVSPLSAATDVLAVFNPHAGLVRIARSSPLELEDYLQILEGRPWSGPTAGGKPVFFFKVYSALQAWSASPKGLPFLLHGGGNHSDRLNEIFFLKLSALHQMFKEVRSYVKVQQLPLLNLSPASFRMSVPEVGDQFPALWATKCLLIKPGQAYPLQIKLTEQKYFIRLGRIEPSPFLPEGLGTHSFGIGSVRIRNVTTETDGVVLEGTMVAENYLRAEPHDLLWFKLPLGEERLEFFAHVYATETNDPNEARFRTVPVMLAEPVYTALKRVAGTVFAKSPYEVWPLLSSPCDLFSLGVMAVRILLANSTSDFPVILDEVLGLARHFGKELKEENSFLADFKSLLKRDQRFLDLVSPHNLVDAGGLPLEARSRIQMEIWLDTIGLLLRLFPGTGAQGFCSDFGDVSPFALETVFDRPIEELETLIIRLRCVLAPSLFANEEIAEVIQQKLTKL